MYGKDKDLSEFGQKLKLLRIQKNVSIREVSGVTNISRSNISDYENGKVDPSLSSAKALADYYQVSLDWLVGVSAVKKIAN